MYMEANKKAVQWELHHAAMTTANDSAARWPGDCMTATPSPVTAYDFSEGTLIALAQRATTKAPADALAWLQLNLEYFPLSARTYTAMAQVQQRANDNDAAVKSVEKALDLDPQNAQAKRLLDQLKPAKSQ